MLKAIISNKNWADFFLFPTPSKRFVWFVWFVWFAWGCLMVCFNTEPECRLQWGGSIMSMDTWYNTLLSLRIVGNNLLLFMSARSTYYFNRFISKLCLNRVNFLHCSVLPSFMIIFDAQWYLCKTINNANRLKRLWRGVPLHLMILIY